MATTTLAGSHSHGHGHGHGHDHDLSVFPDELRQKRILLCTESFGPVNGVSRTTMMLVEHLRAHGTRVAVVSPQNHTTKNTFMPHHNDELEVRLGGYPLPLNGELSIAYPVRLSKLFERTFKAPPDLIYLASPASLGFQVMLQVLLAPRASRVPVVCNFQTDLRGYCAILLPWPLNTVAALALEWVESRLFRHSCVQTILYPSRFVRRYLERMHVPPAKLELLQRGVRTELFHPHRRDPALRTALAPRGETVFLCVSRLAGEKGFEFLAAAARALAARAFPFVLHVVGGNPSAEVVTRIRAAFGPLAANGRVVFAGQKTGEALAACFATADVFLHCSVTETFGLVVLESLASGVPVVARDEGGPSDIIQDGVTGYLVPKDDLDLFVERAVGLATDHARRKRMGEDARRQAEAATWEKVNNKVAWCMLKTMRACDQERAGASRRRRRGALLRWGERQLGWAWAGDDMHQRIVDARMSSGLLVVFAFWVLVTVYLLVLVARPWVAWARPLVAPWRHASQA
ncbi:hypothetical protein P8C59_004522 [Phyllachora maydis]|uniref:Glycosyltransferase n=1 Tax=Phyllachora maydis TaxID=1825666 RepID=A0AAD9I2E8_9PEZI|nr:hypothetical protein P8C59_004522 [Phyllachora maydis]